MSTIKEENRWQPWFDDGNVIIAVEGKYFRVHRGVLSPYSSVFKDMFSCSHPDPGPHAVEGCPIIDLRDDSASDVQVILSAMYDRSYPSHLGPIPFPTLSAFLRLGKKYIIRSLFEEGQKSLDVFVRHRTSSVLSCDGTLTFDRNITGVDDNYFQIINLVREVGLLTFLPATLTACTNECPPALVLEGYRDDSGSSFYKLSLENQVACLGAVDSFQMLRAKLFAWLRDPSKRTFCSQPGKCGLGCNQIIRSVWSHVKVELDPLEAWKSSWESFLCAACVAGCKVLHKEARQRVWSELPKKFGIADSWEELGRASFSLSSDIAMS